MTLKFISGAVIVAAMLAAAPALAAPVQVDYGSIRADATEDFEGFPVGARPSNPFDFGDFSYSTTGGPSVSTFSCSSPSDICLSDFASISGPRIFSTSAPGATFFGFELTPLFDRDVFTIEVTGLSGVASFNISGAGFYGFGDLAGLVSVSIANNGLGASISNYGLDDLVLQIDPVSDIPLPAALPLFLAGMAGVGAAARKRRKSTSKTCP
ncbi:MAG: hypothetical protein AAGA09_07560 [Pseudomonadota bacterium]